MPSVFVSHRLSDTVEAARLAAELAAAGHDVRLAEWEVRVGDSILKWMDDRLQTSSYVVLCYSDAGAMSSWISREWMSAFARQLNGAGVRLLPVRLTGGEPPARLADLKYADLVTDWDKGVRAVLAAID